MRYPKNKKKRKNRNRRRKERRRAGALVPAAAAPRRFSKLSVRPQPLELIRGHDGFFRGRPEPVVLVAAYWCRGDDATLISRSLLRFAPTDDAPTFARPVSEDPRPSQQIERGVGAVVLLAVCIEEDDGGDIEDFYAALSETDDLVVWSLASASDAVPVHLHGIAELTEPSCGVQLGVRGPGGPPVDTFRRDDYVGTAGFWLQTERPQRDVEVAATVRSRDGRNEWGLRFSLTLR